MGGYRYFEEIINIVIGFKPSREHSAQHLISRPCNELSAWGENPHVLEHNTATSP